MLTAKQRELLLFIHARLTQSGVSPSFEEMKEALDLKSKSGVHRLIGALEERGFLGRLPHRARALEVLRLPDDMRAADTAHGADGTHDPDRADAEIVDLAARRSQRHNPPPHSGPDESATCILRLAGRIAAGLPIEAIEGREELAVPAALLGAGEHYALEVVGDSMIEAGILNGDFALVRQTESASEGDIVVALIDGEEATLKYYHRERGAIRLDPANAAYQPQRYPPARVRIQGRLAGLLRRY